MFLSGKKFYKYGILIFHVTGFRGQLDLSSKISFNNHISFSLITWQAMGRRELGENPATLVYRLITVICQLDKLHPFGEI